MAKRIIVLVDETVTCPDCGAQFALGDGITRQTIESHEQRFTAELDAQRQSLQREIEQQVERRAAQQFQARINELNEKLEQSREAQKRVDQRLNEATERAAEAARAEGRIQSEALRAELTRKDEKIKEFRIQELELRRQKEQLDEARQELELQLQRRLDAEKLRLEQQVSEQFRLREAEYKKKIDDAQKANETLKRKLEQGSQQLRGEVLELEIELLLSNAFPLDRIEEVRKGQRGADVVQTVVTRTGSRCGTIVWESKRAERWSNAWIPKLKDDQQAIGAEIAVLVSTAFPVDSKDPFLSYEGVWLVRPGAIRPVAEALRAILIQSHKQRVISHGKNEKMEAVYDYLCSPQFAQKLRAILDAYEAMRDDLEKEKSAMARLWKKRDMQLERITANMMGLCGELQGLTEDSLPGLEFAGQFPLLDKH